MVYPMQALSVEEKTERYYKAACNRLFCVESIWMGIAVARNSMKQYSTLQFDDIKIVTPADLTRKQWERLKEYIEKVLKPKAQKR